MCPATNQYCLLGKVYFDESAEEHQGRANRIFMSAKMYIEIGRSDFKCTHHKEGQYT